MTRRTPIAADEATLAELRMLAKSKLRAEAHRALAVLWMLDGIGDAEIAQRLRMAMATGRVPVAGAERLLGERQDDDPPLTLARIQAAYLAESGQTIDAGHLSVVLRKKGASRGV